MDRLNVARPGQVRLTAVRRAAGRLAATLPQLDGKLLMDEASLDRAADDFGHLVHRRPLAVLVPRTGDDVVRMILFARRQGIKIGPRGQAKSAFGQAQVEDGVVIKMGSLDRPPSFAPGRVEVSAGMTWRQVLAATLERGLRPPMLAQTTYLSVGGTLAFGGIDGGSFRGGALVDSVLELQVVTGAGRLETCSPTRQPELFEATLAGMGQCGIILRATLPLVPAETHVRSFVLLYRELAALLADERGPVFDGRFDRAIGYAMPSASGGWTYYLLAARNFTHPELPDEEAILAGLGHVHGFERSSSLSYFASTGLGRGTGVGGWLHGSVGLPHPWLAVMVPAAVIQEYAAQVLSVLKPSARELDFLVEFHRLNTGLCRRPLFRLPQGPDVFLVVILGTLADPAAAMETLERNRRFFERARQFGGTLIPAGAVPLSPQDWREHYGPVWESFEAAKRRFDPDKILSPGPGIF